MSLCSYNKLSVKEADSVWQRICTEAEHAAHGDRCVAQMMQKAVLQHQNLDGAISFQIAEKLQTDAIKSDVLRQVLAEQHASNPRFRQAVAADIKAVFARDAACHRMMEPIFYFKGFLALQAYRYAHSCWLAGRRDLAYYLQSRSSSVFQVDIHPASQIGCGVFFDHATGVVIGETSVVEDDVSILHAVTLGGTGKDSGDRHPKIRYGVLIGAGAKILGNIEVGSCSKVAAGSVVLKTVPAHMVVAGVPAKPVCASNADNPASDMDHFFSFAEGI